MQERLETLRTGIDAIRKSGKLPHWRMVYAENLLNRAGEYLAVDRLPEANMVADKLDRWIKTHTPRGDSSERFSENPMVFWNAEMLLGMSAKLKQTLLEKRQLVPSTERESTIRRLTLVEGWIREGKLLQAHEELLSLRTALIARLRRSFRARLVATDLYHGSVQPAGSCIRLKKPSMWWANATRSGSKTSSKSITTCSVSWNVSSPKKKNRACALFF